MWYIELVLRSLLVLGGSTLLLRAKIEREAFSKSLAYVAIYIPGTSKTLVSKTKYRAKVKGSEPLHVPNMEEVCLKVGPLFSLD